MDAALKVWVPWQHFIPKREDIRFWTPRPFAEEEWEAREAKEVADQLKSQACDMHVASLNRLKVFQ